MALILAMLAFVPSIVIFMGAPVCFVTGVVALACIRATPRLAIATLYWSAATILAPWIVYLGGWAIGCVALVGFLLLIGLAEHYDAA